MPDPNEALLELTDAITKAIEEFNSKKKALRKAAFEHGGDDEVDELQDALDDVRNARSTLIQRSLDTAAPGFAQLAKDAKAETTKLERTIRELKAASEIIGTAAGLVNILGRLIIRFGL